MSNSGYQGLNVYYGDLHSHCHQVGYGYGSVEEAYQNARTQLDFASVTAHAHWPDLPEADERLAATVAYHQQGFRRAAEAWGDYRQITEAIYRPDRFVSFPSFEWHSLRHGDHNVYFNGPANRIIRAPTLETMRIELRQLREQGRETFLIPHHIGYLQGYRGINWADFTPEFSPVVEMFSMHGQAESDDAPYPYMHTMGPRDERSTVQHGLRTGRVFGVVGSTDHHSAFPGSYGFGRVAVWAGALTRESIWRAIAARRTYALTGDRVQLAFAINGQPMGAILPAAPEREIEVAVTGGAPLDYVEVLHNNRPIHRWSAHEVRVVDAAQPVKVLVEVGWGQKDKLVDWQVELEVSGGKLLSVEPRFRGPDIVAPQADTPEKIAFSNWQQMGASQVRFTTQTWGNPTITTPATQGICLEINGDDDTRLLGQINGQRVELTLADLKQGGRTGYLGGFLSPAYCFHRAVPQQEYRCHTSLAHHPDSSGGRDWYYVRVCQKNGQWAWSSPIWVSS